MMRWAPIRAWLAIGLMSPNLACCASHVKGSWACALQPGVFCGSIADIDRGGPSKPVKAATAPDPVVAGAIPARLWDQGGWTAGPIAGAPVREADPILKVAIAPWIDGQGDYHGGAEVFAIMRQGGWFIGPDGPPRVDLTPLAKPRPADPPPRAARSAPATASQ